MSDALKPQLHGRDHRPGGRDPIPGFGVIDYARIERAGTTNQNVLTATNTTLAGNANTVTNSSVFSVASNTTITCKLAGLYSIHGLTNWDTYDATARTLWIRDGSANLLLDSQLADNGFDWVSISGDVRLAANTALTLIVFQRSGSTQTLYGGGSGWTANFLEVRYLGAYAI